MSLLCSVCLGKFENNLKIKKMKRYLIEKFESTVNVDVSPIDKKAKNGEVCDHKQTVDSIVFYTRQNNGLYFKVFVTKEMVMSFYEEIKKIEAQIVKLPKDDIPF